MKTEDIMKLLNSLQVKFSDAPDFNTYKEGKRLQHLITTELQNLTQNERRDIINKYLANQTQNLTDEEVEHYLRWLKILI